MASQKMACVFIAVIAMTLVSAQAQAPVQAPSPNFFSAPPPVVVAPVMAPAAAVPSMAPTISTPPTAVPTVATPAVTPSVAPSTVPAATPVEVPVVAPAVDALTVASAPAPGPATVESAGAMVSISGWRTIVLASGIGILAAAAF